MSKRLIFLAVVVALVAFLFGRGFEQGSKVDVGGVNVGPQVFTDGFDTAGSISVNGTTVLNTSRELTNVNLGAVGTGLSVFEQTATVSAATTLTTEDSNKTVYVDTTGAAYTLPAVASSNGVVIRFVVGAAFSTNAVITSAEGDNIEGALIVAGAVVDCDANDVITFVADGENLGDFVEIRSNGSKWFIGASGALTASKLTCTG